jgi:hypothetical protein
LLIKGFLLASRRGMLYTALIRKIAETPPWKSLGGDAYAVTKIDEGRAHGPREMRIFIISHSALG